MNDRATHASHHPALRRIAASGLAARAIERTAYRFTAGLSSAGADRQSPNPTEANP